VPVHHPCRDFDCGLVILGVKPLAGRDSIDPVEPIKPVTCHTSEPEYLRRENRGLSAAETMFREFGFNGRSVVSQLG
jgi:hypothetical protein